MKEYIEREAGCAVMPDDYYGWRDKKLLKSIPAADVRPVKRGKWVGYPECLKYPNAYADDHIVCSACEECFSILDNDCERFNFCPSCGARMEERENEKA